MAAKRATPGGVQGLMDRYGLDFEHGLSLGTDNRRVEDAGWIFVSCTGERRGEWSKHAKREREGKSKGGGGGTRTKMNMRKCCCFSFSYKAKILSQDHSEPGPGTVTLPGLYFIFSWKWYLLLFSHIFPSKPAFPSPNDLGPTGCSHSAPPPLLAWFKE